VLLIFHVTAEVSRSVLSVLGRIAFRSTTRLFLEVLLT